MADDLNEVIEEVIDDASVITVPIDDTLSNSGEAADAKAVGDALALKADKSELQTSITVNGQSADAQGSIIVTAADTQISGTDQTTVKAAIEAVDGKTAEDIPVASGSSQTIKQALDSGATRTADQIPMSGTDSTTVKTHIDSLTGDVSDLDDAVSTLASKTAADILYNTGSQETIKQHIETMEAGTVKTVNEIGPDADGNIDIERVPYADNLYSEDQENVTDSFLIRTTAGSGSLSDGNAWAQVIRGNRTHPDFVPESLQMTVNAMPRPTPPAITATLNEATFEAYVETAGTYTVSYDGTAWDTDPTLYGLTISNTPVDGDVITMVWDGVNDAVVSITAGPRTAPPAITATIDRDTFVSYVTQSGTTTLTFTTAWSADPEDYGITVTNDPIAGDQIVVVYVKEVRGTITVGHPTALVATGWNLYNHTAGYARVVRYSDTYGYLVQGTYTALKFAETPSGTQTTITPDSSGLFQVPSDGYVIVTGGNNTNTAIICTWSDWTSGPSVSWEAYTESGVSLSSIMTADFPYGLCKIIDGTVEVFDEIDFVHKEAISRITRMEYTEANLETVKAAGRPYEYDEDYIYQERASYVVTSISVDEEYQVSEHGLEWFADSAIELYSEILYGTNLKDKLKRDVVTLSEQTLTSGQQAQVRTNIGAGSAADVSSNSTAIATKADYLNLAKTEYTVNSLADVQTALTTEVAKMSGRSTAVVMIAFGTTVSQFPGGGTWAFLITKAGNTTYFNAYAHYATGKRGTISGQIVMVGYDDGVWTFTNITPVPTTFTLSPPTGWSMVNQYCHCVGNFVYISGMLRAETAITAKSLVCANIIPSEYSSGGVRVSFTAFDNDADTSLHGLLIGRQISFFRPETKSLKDIEFNVSYYMP